MTYDIAVFCTAFHRVRRGYDLSHTPASSVMQLPHDEGCVFNFHLGKTLRSAAAEAVVVQRDRECPEFWPTRAVRVYKQAALATDWDLSQGHLIPTQPPQVRAAPRSPPQR